MVEIDLGERGGYDLIEGKLKGTWMERGGYDLVERKVKGTWILTVLCGCVCAGGRRSQRRQLREGGRAQRRIHW